MSQSPYSTLIHTGVLYTAYSEWMNTLVRRSRKYSDLMPVIPGLEVRVSPLLQWAVIPVLALWVARRPRRRDDTRKAV